MPEARVFAETGGRFHHAMSSTAEEEEERITMIKSVPVFADFSLLLFLCAFVSGCSKKSPSPSVFSLALTQTPHSFIQGVDASYLPEIEDSGGVFYDHGVAGDALKIFKDRGINFIRLRIWNNPAKGYNDLAHVLEMARRVKVLGMGLVIDFHYSDDWADPAKQIKPAAWNNLSFDKLETAVHDYSRDVVAALKQQGTLPDMVQIGNEITPGILWADGRVGGSWDSNWPRFAKLLKAGINGVGESLSSGESVGIILHVDAGGNNETCRWFFDHIQENQVPFDLIGLSYYPWWHGSLSDLENNIRDLAERYDKPVLVMETAYPWSTEDYDGTGNLVIAESPRLPDFPATVQGQNDFLLAEKKILQNIPHGRGLGMFYWAADDISTSQLGSNWENVTLFDFQGNALESLDVFKSP
jgi:arabinogalactan endo-1,4-beta-galactosidase